MDITFTCPHCGEVTLIDESFVGQAGECRACGEFVVVPKLTEKDWRIPESGGAHVGSRPTPWLVWIAWIAVLAPLLVIGLLPMLPIARGGSRGPSKRMQPQNGLRQVMLALQAYEAKWGQLPRAYWRNEEGEIGLPWRAAILPYLEQQPLFDRYEVSEAWNSPTNYAVTATTVGASVNPNDPEYRSSQTGFVAVTGPGSLFIEGENKRLADCKLKPNQTIVLIEIPNSDVHWSEPVDVDLFAQLFRSAGPHKPGRRFLWLDGAEVAYADGSIRQLTVNQLEKALREMFSSASPEEIRAQFSAMEE